MMILLLSRSLIDIYFTDWALLTTNVSLHIKLTARYHVAKDDRSTLSREVGDMVSGIFGIVLEAFEATMACIRYLSLSTPRSDQF